MLQHAPSQISALPPGAFLVRDFLGAAELKELFRRLSAVPEWTAVTFRGQVARRAVLAFGVAYDASSRRVAPAPPLPDWLGELRDRAVQAARGVAGDALVLAGGAAPADFDTATVIRYPAGGGIGWHTDAPVHGPTVLGVSIGAPAWFDMQRRAREPREVSCAAPPVRFLLEPGSLLVMAGEARRAWTHRIPPIRAPRFSLTFRTRARAA